VVRAYEQITPRLVLADRVRLGRGAHIACVGEVVFEADVGGSDDIFVTDCRHGEAGPRSVRICTGAYLGCGSVVLPGVTVGPYAYVGEGAVVSSDVPAHSVVYGNPARVVDGSVHRR
jgi:acetyltransferase-like isoleucine patch superfamily enzyme